MIPFHPRISYTVSSYKELSSSYPTITPCNGLESSEPAQRRSARTRSKKDGPLLLVQLSNFVSSVVFCVHLCEVWWQKPQGLKCAAQTQELPSSMNLPVIEKSVPPPSPFLEGQNMPGQHLALNTDTLTSNMSCLLKAECGIIRDKTRLGHWQGSSLHASLS